MVSPTEMYERPPSAEAYASCLPTRVPSIRCISQVVRATSSRSAALSTTDRRSDTQRTVWAAEAPRPAPIGRSRCMTRTCGHCEAPGVARCRQAERWSLQHIARWRRRGRGPPPMTRRKVSRSMRHRSRREAVHVLCSARYSSPLSRMMVTGPSFTRVTLICAPKRPRST